MSWILTGLLLGSIVTSQHETREACEGRAVLLREKGAGVKCESMSSGATITSYGTVSPYILTLPNHSDTGTSCVIGDGRAC